jgi:hypothetical protein
MSGPSIEDSSEYASVGGITAEKARRTGGEGTAKIGFSCGTSPSEGYAEWADDMSEGRVVVKSIGFRERLGWLGGGFPRPSSMGLSLKRAKRFVPDIRSTLF